MGCPPKARQREAVSHPSATARPTAGHQRKGCSCGLAGRFAGCVWLLPCQAEDSDRPQPNCPHRNQGRYLQSPTRLNDPLPSARLLLPSREYAKLIHDPPCTFYAGATKKDVCAATSLVITQGCPASIHRINPDRPHPAKKGDATLLCAKATGCQQVDLLPLGTNNEAVKEWLTAMASAKGVNVIHTALVSSKSRAGIPEATAYIRQTRRGRDVYIVGAANVGKSAFSRWALLLNLKGDIF